jgi:uncharacterized protein (TIGR01777 family)
MKVLITGGTGAIGLRLVTHLAKSGHDVVVLSRSPASPPAGFPESARIVGWDARTPQGWGDEVNTAEAIVNFAGAPLPGEGFFPARWTPARRQLIIDSRVQAGQAVVQAIRQASRRPSVVLQASAVGYYGPNPPGEVSEDAPPGKDFLSSVTLAWEASTSQVESLGVRQIVARTGIVLDPNAGALLRLLLPFRLFVGGPMGSGRQWMPWIHPHDVTAALAFLLAQPDASGPFNLTAPQPVTNREFASTLGRTMRRPSWFPVPGFALRLAFGDVATTVLDGQRAVPTQLTRLGFDFHFTTLDSALRDLLG